MRPGVRWPPFYVGAWVVVVTASTLAAETPDARTPKLRPPSSQAQGSQAQISQARQPESPAARSPGGALRVARLVHQLGSPESPARKSAEDALGELKAESRARLQQALVDDDPEICLRARVLLDECLAEDLWLASEVDMPAEQRLASSVLASIVAQTGNRMLIGDQFGGFNDGAFQQSGRRLPYWQAIDKLCRVTDNHLRSHHDARAGGLVICSGRPGKFPSAYAGPLRAQIVGARRVFVQELDYAQLDSDITHTFQLNLQLTWEDRFHLLGYTTQPVLVEVRTDTGQELTAVQPSSGSWNAVTPSARQITASLRLSPPPTGAKQLDVLTLRWPLFAVGDFATLVVPNVAAGKTYAEEDLELCVESIEKQPTGRYEMVLIVSRDWATPEPAEILFQENEVELFDSAGRPFRVQNVTHQLVDRGVQMRLQFAGDWTASEPGLLRLTYPRLRAQRDMELIFRDVPLPSAEPR